MGRLRDWVASVFRSLNARLITTDNFLYHKLLKGTFLISVIAFKLARSKGAGEKPVLVENFDGNIRIKLDRSRVMGAVMYWTGFHEYRELAFLHRYLKKEMVFVDVGANLGEFTLFAAKRVSSGRVYSFEPLPDMHKVLTENVGLNKFSNIELYELGLSNKEELLTIYELESEHEGLATLFPGEQTQKGSVTVRLVTLDKFFQSSTLSRLDFIKLDIEGGELFALQGSESLIRKFRPAVMVEINKKTFDSAGYTTDKVLRFFENLEYTPFKIGKSGKLDYCTSLPEFGNIVFTPQRTSTPDS